MTPKLDREERVLAWGTLADGRVVVATNRGLWLPDLPERLGWHRIHKATWGDDTLTIVGSADSPADPTSPDAGFSVVADTEPVSVALADPGDLPKRVRERVTVSVAYTSLHPLPGGSAARVVARRVSGRDGLSWSVRYEGRTDPADPVVASATAELVAAAKVSISQAD